MAIVNVSNFAELKTAIEDSTSTEILVNGDIVFSGGAKVNIAKSNLVIDFNNFSVTDSNTLSVSDSIYVPSTKNTIEVTVKNAVWSGRNYYGVVGVYDGNTNTTINIENINYTGPQFVYNKNGITNITECTVKLDKNGSSANPQEFCEANRLNIAGRVEVISYAQSDATIWFTGTGASLTVQAGASFVVNASATYFLYTDVSPTMLFRHDSSTVITTKSGLFYAAGSSSHIAESFTLEENASFVAYKMNSNSIPMFKCKSNFVLKENSTFRLFSELISSTALVYFGQAANVQINSPKNVVFYNRGGSVFSFQTGSASSPNLISINAEMIRMWNIATSPLSSAGGFSDVPTSEYFKQNYAENLQMSVKTSGSQVLEVENNLSDGDSGYPVTTSSLKILTSNVISIGKIDLTVNQITDQSTSVTGETYPDANLKLEYDGTSELGTASENGSFAFDLNDKLGVDTNVTVSVNDQFLTKTQSYVVEGTVSITNISPINFFNFTENGNQSIIFRQNANWALEVTDTRSSGAEWYLYARILNPLTSGNDTLDNALVFKQNQIVSGLSQTPLLIFTGKWDKDNKVTNVTWENVEGFLLQIDTSKTYNKGDYQTSILWEITTEPI